MPDERGDEPVRLGTAGSHVQEGVVASVLAALVRFLLGVQRGVFEESVLEIVDSDLRRLLVGDRAEVTRDLQTSLVRLLDRGGELLARDVFVSLERGHAVIRPKSNGLTRILRPRESERQR